MAKNKTIKGLFTLVASRNKNRKNIEKTPMYGSANPGSGYSKSHKKVKPVKGSFPRNFPGFKVVN